MPKPAIIAVQGHPPSSLLYIRPSAAKTSSQFTRALPVVFNSCAQMLSISFRALARDIYRSEGGKVFATLEQPESRWEKSRKEHDYLAIAICINLEHSVGIDLEQAPRSQVLAQVADDTDFDVHVCGPRDQGNL